MKTKITLEVSSDEYLLIKKIMCLSKEEIEKRLNIVFPKPKPIEELDLPIRVINSLRRSGWETIDDAMETLKKGVDSAKYDFSKSRGISKKYAILICDTLMRMETFK